MSSEEKGAAEKPLILGKFKTQADLEKSYTELEKKLSTTKIKGDESGEEVLKKHESFYGKALEEKSSLEGNLKSLSEKIASSAKLPASLVDSITKAVHEESSASAKKENQKGVEAILKDEDKKLALVEALGEDKLEDFNKRHQEGRVSANEVNLILKGASKGENTKGIYSGVKTISNEEALRRLNEITEDARSAYYNPASPGHKEAVAEMKRLKSQLGIA